MKAYFKREVKRNKNKHMIRRVVDPPGTKGGPRAGNFPGLPKNTFCPGWSHDPGQKALLSRVVVSLGTKGGGAFCPGSWFHPGQRGGFCPGWIHDPGQKVFLGGPGKFPDRGPPLVPGGLPPRTKGARFPSFPPNLMFVFISFYFSFKIGFHLLIQLIKLWFQKLWNKISYMIN